MIKATIKSLFALLFVALVVAPTSVSAQTCMEDQAGGGQNCTANDSEDFVFTVLNIDEACNVGVLGEAQVDVSVIVGDGNAGTRYDIGLFVATDGGNALNGSCYRQFPVSGDLNATDEDQDTCWDKGTTAGVVMTANNVRVVCPLNGDSTFVSACVSWGQNSDKVDTDGNDTCDNVDDLIPGSTSKCVCGTANLGQLPVELTSFEARLVDSDVVLNWETASEGSNAGFAIEHSDNGGPFEEVAFVAGAGTSLNVISYTYTVNEVSVGLHRFRLRQVDFDGAFTYSSTVEVTSEVPGTHLLSEAYPNPFNPSTSFSLAVSREQEVSINVYDMLGRHVSSLFRGTIEANVARTFAVNAATWTSGSYTVVVEGEAFRDSRNLVLLK
jgi:hypothetical protein